MAASVQIAEVARQLRALSLDGIAYRAECATAVARNQEDDAQRMGRALDEIAESSCQDMHAVADAPNVVRLVRRVS